MNAKSGQGATGSDRVKLAGAAGLIIAGIYGFYYFAAHSTLLRVIALLAVGGLAAAIALQTDPGRRLRSFVGDARAEVRKVVWPTRQETMQTTVVVIVMVFVLGIILWLFDLILGAILRALTGLGG